MKLKERKNLPCSNFPLSLPLHQHTERVTSNSAMAFLNVVLTTVPTENSKPYIYITHPGGKTKVCPYLRK